MRADVIPAQKVISHLATFRWHRERIRMKNQAGEHSSDPLGDGACNALLSTEH